MDEETRYLPERCPLCAESVAVVYEDVQRDMPCANCGYYMVQASKLLALVTKIVGEQSGIDPAKLTVNIPLQQEIGTDSLDMVELVMNLEDRIPPELNAESLTSCNLAIESSSEVTIGNIVRCYCRRAHADD